MTINIQEMHTHFDIPQCGLFFLSVYSMNRESKRYLFGVQAKFKCDLPLPVSPFIHDSAIHQIIL